MDKLFENLPQIIKEAAKSYLGLFALMVVVLSFLGFSFFYGASENVRLFIFLLLFAGVVAFCVAMFRAIPGGKTQNTLTKEEIGEATKVAVKEAVKELGLSPPISNEEFEKQIKSYEAKLSRKELELFTERLEKAKLLFERGTERLEAQDYEGAIKDLEETLKILPEGSEASLSVHFNLGIALIQFPRGDRESNLKKAIESYKKILSFYTIEKTPERYASSQNNLGLAYGNLSEVRDKESNLGLAIQAYNEALRVMTKEAFPWYFVETSSNLARALYIKGDVARGLKVMEVMLPVAEEVGHPGVGKFRQVYGWFKVKDEFGRIFWGE